MAKYLLLVLSSMMYSFLIQAQNLTVQQNNIIEWGYTSAQTYSNPFRDVKIDVIVHTPSGKTLAIPGFWAGENKWKFRFSSYEKGVFKFKTVCNDYSNGQLHGKEGSITVVDYKGANPLFKHGPLRVSSNKRSFEHYDGTPFFWLADQWWHGMTTRFKWPEDFHTLTADRKEKGYSVVGFAVGFPCDIAPFDVRGKNEAGDPWMDSTFTSINPSYFDLTDLRINHLVSEGIMPSIMGAWGYYIKWSGVENMKEHYRYLIARYGAYPITWILCGEVTLAYYTDLGSNWDYYKTQFREQWSEVGRYLHENDPFNRLVTVHPGPGINDGKPPLSDMNVCDFIMLQSGHSGFRSIEDAIKQVKENLELYPNRPVLHGEVSFEGMKGSCRDDVQRFLFWSNVLSGTAGFSYGAEGIWQFNTEEELFGATPGGSVWGNVPWEICYKYPGAKQVALGKKIMEQFEYWKFEPFPERIELKGAPEIYSPYCAGVLGQVMLIYMNNNAFNIIGLTPGKKYQYQFFDPMTETAYPKISFVAGDDGKWNAKNARTPVKRDYVLAIYE